MFDTFEMYTVALNRWASVPAACIELVADKRLARQMCRELTHMQAFGRPEWQDT